MKKILKYFTVMLFIVSFAFSAAGCGKKNDVPDFSTGTQEQSSAPQMDLGEEINYMAFRFGMQQLGDELCYISYDSEKGQTLEKYSLNDNSRTSVSFTWLEPEKGQNIMRFAFAADGSIYAIVSQRSEQDSNGNYFITKQLSKFDAEGKQSFAADISEQINEEVGNGVNMLAADAQGRIYIAGKTKVWLYDFKEGEKPDYQGEVLVCPGGEDEGSISDITCGKDGNVYVCCRKENRGLDAGYSLMQIDFDNRKVGAVYEDFPGAGGLVLGMEKDFLVHDNKDVYEYDLASKTMEPVLNWLDNNVMGVEVQYFGTLGNGNIYVVTRDQRDDELGVMMLSRTESGGQKEEIILAYMYYNVELQRAVVDFNKSSDKYKIVLKEYNYNESQSLLIDIVVDCPDILDLNGLNVEQLADKGVFTDLGAYLDNSQVLERSDYLENVLEAYTFDGKLVTIPLSFSVMTIMADAGKLKEVFGADFEGGWTVEELMAYADAYPEAELFDQFSKDMVMRYLMLYGKNSFVDWETGKCSFDSDRFKRILEFVGRFPDETMAHSASTAARMEAGEVLLDIARIDSFDGLQMYEQIFGGEAACVGFPTADGSAGDVLVANTSLAISASSSHKEGAWEFIEGVLEDTAQNESSVHDFVTNRTRLEKNMEAALEAEYAAYDDGTLRVNDEGRYYMINYTNRKMTFPDGWTFVNHPPTDEEVYEVFALIGKAVRRPGYDSSVILGIINEEAEAFYHGQKSVEQVMDLIQNRVQLYVDEHMD